MWRLQITGLEKTVSTKKAILFLQNYLEKTKTIWKHVKFKLLTCTSRKFWWTIGGCHQKMSWTFCLTVSDCRKNSERVLVVFLKISVLFESSGGAFLSGAKILVNYRGGFYRKLTKICLQEELHEGALWCFSKILMSKNFLHITIFRRISFNSQTWEFLWTGLFAVLEYSPVLGINCTCMLEKNLPGKTNGREVVI